MKITDNEEQSNAAEVTAEEKVKKEEKTHKKTSELKTKLELAEKTNDELNDRLLRSAAEFDNYKKRTLKEKEELSGYTKALCIKELLTVLDSFERAMETECRDEEYKKGMDMIFKQFANSLASLGVAEIEAYNQPFNPEFHNAVNQTQDESFGENTVCQVLQKGYKIGNHVIRHAMVVVANP